MLLDPKPVEVEPNGLAVAVDGAAEVAAGVEKLKEGVVDGAVVADAAVVLPKRLVIVG